MLFTSRNHVGVQHINKCICDFTFILTFRIDLWPTSCQCLCEAWSRNQALHYGVHVACVFLRILHSNKAHRILTNETVLSQWLTTIQVRLVEPIFLWLVKCLWVTTIIISVSSVVIKILIDIDVI